MRKKERTDKEEILFRFFYDIADHNGIVDKSSGGFRPGAEDNPLYKSAVNTLEDRLSRGWTVSDVAMRILSAKDLRVKTPHLYQILPENPPVTEREDQDLLQPSERYSHHRLKKQSRPICDYETGEPISKGSQERIDKFTLSDLINYYLSELDPPSITRKEVSSILRYSLNNGVKLESILRGIDLWTMSTDINRGNDPWILIREYVPEAVEEEREGVREDYGESSESIF